MAEPDPVGRMRIARGRDGVHTGDDDRLPPLEEEVREFEALWPLKRFVEELPYTVLDVVKATQNLQPFMGRKASLTVEW